MHNAEKLLISYCDALIELQFPQGEKMRGGFRCPACETVHGRADNAVFPLVYAFVHTGEEKYLKAAEELFSFRRLLSHADGSVQNDFGSGWKGITVFSSINIYKTLRYFGAFLPYPFRDKLTVLFRLSAQWVHENIKPGFRSNINYYAASCCVQAMYGKFFGDETYLENAKKLLDYCLSNITENGLVTGEGQPHNFRTKKGCAPIDIGYDLEESMPCLVDAAEALGDEEALDTLAAHMKKMLAFMFPDGGWDNSFGVRNNKWTYYGSRTSDGVLAAFVQLGKRDAVFYEAARRTLNLWEKCTKDGLLYGGMQYIENGQKPCVHHTFCHAAALADALCIGIPEEKPSALPVDEVCRKAEYYPELDTYKIYAGPWIATVTAYDYSTYTYVRGAAHASGGAMSMLYHRATGPVIAGSVYEYKLTEPFNMQQPVGVLHHTLIPRAEYEKGGVMYSTCLDGQAQMSLREQDGKFLLNVTAKFRNIAEKKAEDETLFAEILYTVSEEAVEISARLSEKREGVRFVLPIVENAASVQCDAPCESEKIFFLTGGFKATEYSALLTDSAVNFTIIGG